MHGCTPRLFHLYWWVQVYWGCGLCCCFSSSWRVHLSLSLPLVPSVFTAEMCVIFLAFPRISFHDKATFVIYSDSRSALQALPTSFPCVQTIAQCFDPLTWTNSSLLHIHDIHIKTLPLSSSHDVITRDISSSTTLSVLGRFTGKLRNRIIMTLFSTLNFS